jgi:hypothetical protein
MTTAHHLKKEALQTEIKSNCQIESAKWGGRSGHCGEMLVTSPNASEFLKDAPHWNTAQKWPKQTEVSAFLQWKPYEAVRLPLENPLPPMHAGTARI